MQVTEHAVQCTFPSLGNKQVACRVVICLKLIALLAVWLLKLVRKSKAEAGAEVYMAAKGCEDGREATTRKKRAQVTTNIKYAKHYLLIINRGYPKTTNSSSSSFHYVEFLHCTAY